MNVLTVRQKVGVFCAGCGAWLCLALCLALPALCGTPLVGPPSPASGEGWVEMPAGARPAYIGIHGGTVPVSLLTARDGRSMITFVGRTGNDFLRILHKTDILRPEISDLSDLADMPGPPDLEDRRMPPPGSNATVLMADTAIGNVPVFYCTGKGFARLGAQDWLPFGLSEKPLQLEGQAGRPLHMADNGRHKKFRRYLLQQRLQGPRLLLQ